MLKIILTNQHIKTIKQLCRKLCQMALKIDMIKMCKIIWKQRAAVYTTTALYFANLFIVNLLTILNTLFNTPKVAY